MEEAVKSPVKVDFNTCLLCNKYFDKKPDIDLSSPEVTGFESGLKLFCELISGSSNEVFKYLKFDSGSIDGPTFCSECHFNLLEFERCERIIKETKLAQEAVLRSLKGALLHPKSLPLLPAALQSSCLEPNWVSLRQSLIEEIKKTEKHNFQDEAIIDCDDDEEEDRLDEDPLAYHEDDFPSPLGSSTDTKTYPSLGTDSPIQNGHELDGRVSASSNSSINLTKPCIVSIKRLNLEDFPNLKINLNQSPNSRNHRAPSMKKICSDLIKSKPKLRKPLKRQRPCRGNQRARNDFVFFVISEPHKLLLFRRTPVRYSTSGFQCLEVDCSHEVAGTDFDAFASMKSHILSSHPSPGEFDHYLRSCPICEEKIQSGLQLRTHLFSEHSLKKSISGQRVVCESCWKISGYTKHALHTWFHKNEEEKAAELQSGKALPFELKDRLQKKGLLSVEDDEGSREASDDEDQIEEVKQEEEAALQNGKLPFKLRRLLGHKRKTKWVARPKQCEICKKVLSDRRAWRYHIKTHKSREDRKKVSCPKCGVELISHLSSHLKRYCKAGLEATSKSQNTEVKLEQGNQSPSVGSIKNAQNVSEKKYFFFVISETDKILLLERTPIRYSSSGLHCLEAGCSHEVSGTDLEAFASIKSHILSDHPNYCMTGVIISSILPRTCPICKENSAKFPNGLLLRKHLFAEHAPSKLGVIGQKVVCEVCGKVVSYGKHGIHTWTHKNDEEKAAEIEKYGSSLPYEIKEKLKKKGEVFKEAKKGENEVKKKKQAIPRKCDICDKILSDHSCWVHHMETHKSRESREKFLCPHCGIELISVRCLRKHIKRFHIEEDKAVKLKQIQSRLESVKKAKMQTLKTTNQRRPVKNLKQKRPQQCKICFKTLSDHTNYMEHMKTHRNYEDRPKFQCPECGNLFLSERALSWHQERIHNFEEAPKLECHICQKQFYHKDGTRFRVHVMTHTKETPWICDQCGAGFSANFQLTEHKRGKHGEGNPYKCDLCDKTYVRNGGLRKHLKKVHPEVARKKGERCGRGGIGRRIVS